MSCKPIITLILTILLFGLNSCHTKKSVQTDNQALSPSTLYKELTNTATDWKSVEVPFSVSLTEPTRISLSGRARFERGKAMELSLRMLGIEVARLLIRSDSIFALYRLDKIYLAENISSISSLLPANLENIQDLLIGQPFFLSGSTMKPTDIKSITFEDMADGILIIPKHQPNNLNYGFTATTRQKAFLSRFAIVAPLSNASVNADYTSYPDITPAGFLAETSTIEIISKKFSASARMTWKWKNAKWNNTADITWQAPLNYKRVTAESLIKSLHQ